jgi:hypothetical protein
MNEEISQAYVREKLAGTLKKKYIDNELIGDSWSYAEDAGFTEEELDNEEDLERRVETLEEYAARVKDSNPE